MPSFIFTSKTFAYRGVTQGLSQHLSAFSSFVREYLARVIIAHQCAQYVDIDIAANDANNLIESQRATFECIRDSRIKLARHKCHVGATQTDILGRAITRDEIKPREKQLFWKKLKLPKSNKALKRYILDSYTIATHVLQGFLKKLAPTSNKDQKILVTTELVQQFNEVNKDGDKCRELALKQPLPIKQLVLMTHAIFTKAGYAILTEDDTDRNYAPIEKSSTPFAYGSKTFTPSQLKFSIYEKEFLVLFHAIKEFGHLFWGTYGPNIIFTHDKSVTRFFRTKFLLPPLLNACN